MSFNKPNLKDEQNQQHIKRYVHQPLTIEHYGTNASIQPNGKVLLSKVGKMQGEEVEIAEIEIPASLIFKLAGLLKATRKVEYVAVVESEE